MALNVRADALMADTELRYDVAQWHVTLQDGVCSVYSRLNNLSWKFPATIVRKALDALDVDSIDDTLCMSLDQASKCNCASHNRPCCQNLIPRGQVVALRAHYYENHPRSNEWAAAQLKFYNGAPQPGLAKLLKKTKVSYFIGTTRVCRTFYHACLGIDSRGIDKIATLVTGGTPKCSVSGRSSSRCGTDADTSLQSLLD